MPCYHPIAAWQSPFVKSNYKRKIVFDFVRGYESIALPCGQCIGCRLERSRQWAIRCVLESQLHTHNEFVTLTYNDENLPKNQSLSHRDVQLFLKKLRKDGHKVRYYMCGEYGENFERPHYHLCMFGFEIKDKQPLFAAGGNQCKYLVHRSQYLEEKWGLGYVTIGELNFETAAYVARYCVKKLTGDKAAYGKRFPEYSQMSRRPGIASSWFEEYAGDVLAEDKIITKNLTTKCPKYYDKLIDKVDPHLLKEIKDKRIENLTEPEMSMRRLKTKEEYAVLKAKTLKRGYEKWMLKSTPSMTQKQASSKSLLAQTQKQKLSGV